MSYEVIYIGAAQRSGSTVLDLALSAHNEIVSVGEVHYLKAYALEDRRYYDPKHPLVCSCGAPVPACPFWTAVEDQMERRLDTLMLKPVVLGAPKSEQQGELAHQRVLARLVYRYSTLYRNTLVHRWLGGPQVGADSFALFDAIAAVSSRRYIVDSSKNPFRYASLLRARPEAIRLIILCRDYRAVAHSYARRGVAIRESLRWWTARLEQFDRLSAHVDASRVLRVRYEDLCADTENSLARLWRALGLQPVASGAELKAVAEHHHLGGSPSKFSDRRRITLDTSYKEQFSEQELAAMRSMAGRHASEWGYD